MQQGGVTDAGEFFAQHIDNAMSSVYERDYSTLAGPPVAREGAESFRSQADLDAYLVGLQDEMRAAATNLDFEKAASLRDDIKRLRNPELVLRWPARRA